MMMPAALVRNAVTEQIKISYPDWQAEGYICLNDLNRFRMQYIQNLLESEKGDLTILDQEVLESLQRHETLSRTGSPHFCRTDRSESPMETTASEHLKDA